MQDIQKWAGHQRLLDREGSGFGLIQWCWTSPCRLHGGREIVYRRILQLIDKQLYLQLQWPDNFYIFSKMVINILQWLPDLTVIVFGKAVRWLVYSYIVSFWHHFIRRLRSSEKRIVRNRNLLPKVRIHLRRCQRQWAETKVRSSFLRFQQQVLKVLQQ